MFEWIKNRDINLFAILKESWGELLLLIIPIVITITDILEVIRGGIYWKIAVVSLVIIALIQVASKSQKHIKLEKEFYEIKEERDRLRFDLEDIPERVVKSLFNFLGFDYNERITVYRFNDDSCFVPVGRYSKNMKFKKSGRKTYPNSQGFISLAWHSGEFTIEDLPDPNKATQRYIKIIKDKCPINEETIKGMKMKSRSYHCKNLDNLSGEPVAVIVFESTETSLPASTVEINRILDSSIGTLLSSTIETNLPPGKGLKS